MQIDVTFPCDDGHTMGGVLTLPEGAQSARHPGLLLIYEIFGMNEEMKRFLIRSVRAPHSSRCGNSIPGRSPRLRRISAPPRV